MRLGLDLQHAHARSMGGLEVMQLGLDLPHGHAISIGGLEDI